MRMGGWAFALELFLNDPSSCRRLEAPTLAWLLTSATPASAPQLHLRPHSLRRAPRYTPEEPPNTCNRESNMSSHRLFRFPKPAWMNSANSRTAGVYIAGALVGSPNTTATHLRFSHTNYHDCSSPSASTPSSTSPPGPSPRGTPPTHPCT